MIRHMKEAWRTHVVGGTAVGLVATTAFAFAFALALLFDCAFSARAANVEFSPLCAHVGPTRAHDDSNVL